MSELSAEAINEIVHRRALGQSIRSIARSMCLSRRAVSRALTEHDNTREHGAPHPELPRRRRRRQSVLDGYEAAIGEFIKRYPNITIIRLLEELRGLGYHGGYSILRERVKTLRAPVVTQPVQRFETGPGIQAQMDWAEYTIDFAAEGRRKVNLFSYLLGYSRRQYLRFT
jgi:transposase